MSENGFRFFLFFLCFSSANGQFGEIASIVTGLLGSGAGGAASLGSLAGAGAAAGSGAAGALGQIGTPQAALQLTGTGVGIVNQASESAWFPAAVENAARINRDFQDRLLAGTKKGGAAGVPPPLTMAGLFPTMGRSVDIGGGSELGTEFGKELSSSENTESSTIEQTTTPFPLSTVFGALLPGEVPNSFVKEELAKEEPLEEETHQPAPTITVQLPAEKQKPDVEFSVDSTEESFPLLPPRAQSPAESTLPVDIQPQMVPELQKLINALHKSNLTRQELSELTNQLEANREIGAPRENTTPSPTSVSTEKAPETSVERVENESHRKAVDRNLLALRRALTVPTHKSPDAKRYRTTELETIGAPKPKETTAAPIVVTTALPTTTTPISTTQRSLYRLDGETNRAHGAKTRTDFQTPLPITNSPPVAQTSQPYYPQYYPQTAYSQQNSYAVNYPQQQYSQYYQQPQQSQQQYSYYPQTAYNPYISPQAYGYAQPSAYTAATTTTRPYPVRTLPHPGPPTPPPAVLQYPNSIGTLLTIPQPAIG